MNTVSIGGLDPSLSNFGMSKASLNEGRIIIEDIQLITTKEDKTIKYKNLRDLKRAIELYEAVQSFFDGIDIIYVELPVGSQSARAMASYGLCLGIVGSLGSRVVRVSARDAKLVATNNPEATKEDMINWASTKYPNLPWLTRRSKGELVLTKANEHVADSIATIHAGIKNANNYSN